MENNVDDPSRLTRGQSIGVKFFAYGRETIDVLRPHIMPFVNSPPPTITWLSIPRNIPSAAIQNKDLIPYIGIDAAGDRFIEISDSENENGNHFMDNETFIELVQALIPHQRDTNLSQENESVLVEIPDAIIFSRISERFPGSNADHLREK